MIIRTVLDMNYPVIDVEIEEPEPTEQFANDDFYVDILLKFDESEQSENDKVTFSDNDEPTAEDFIWSNENEVTVDIEDYEPQSKYYLKWSTAYKEACKIIYNKQSKLEDFKKAEQLLLSESKSGNVLAIHDLEKLVRTDVNVVANTETNSNRCYVTNLFNGDRMFFVDAVLNFNSNKATIKLIDHSDATKFKKTYNNNPWIEDPVAVIEDNTLYIYYDYLAMSSNSYSVDITYVKFPTKIEDLPAEGMSEIPEYMQFEVINRAVELALEDIESKRIQTKSQLNQIDE